MNRKKKRLIISLIITALLFIFIISPLFPYVRSLAVMSVYSRLCAKNSLMESENFSLNIPSGEGWYPFVMTFTADSAFSAYTNNPGTKLTILYNFPAFSLRKGCSMLFDKASPYYSSFYGAYLIQCPDGAPFAFSPDTLELDSDSVAEVARFDFFSLVLGDFGLSDAKQVFDYSVSSRKTDFTFAGIGGWTRITSDIAVNGAAHKKEGFVSSYLQYGPPNFPVDADFLPVIMKGIVYGKYFEEWNTSVFFYVMSPSEEICKECERTILSKSTFQIGK